MTKQEIDAIASAVVAALKPLLGQRGSNGEIGTELPDGSQMRAVLSGCTNFSTADRVLEQPGVTSAGKPRVMIARFSPDLYNAFRKAGG
jgi:hypothetical protein